MVDTYLTFTICSNEHICEELLKYDDLQLLLQAFKVWLSDYEPQMRLKTVHKQWIKGSLSQCKGQKQRESFVSSNINEH